MSTKEWLKAHAANWFALAECCRERGQHLSAETYRRAGEDYLRLAESAS